MLLRSIYKYRIHISIFLSVFVLLIIVYSRFGMIITPDSNSYLYILTIFNGKYHPFPDIMRPPIYPLVLLFSQLTGGANMLFYLFMIHAIVLSGGLVLLYGQLQRLFSEKLVIFAVLYLCVINYHTIQYINYVTPEILLTVTVIIFLYFSSSVQRDIRSIIPMIISLTLLTMIKPIFIYFPIFIGFTFLLYNALRVVGKKALLFFIIGCALLYILPVFLWTYGNKVKNNIFVFSNIQTVNTLGKLLQYQLADKGPDVVDSFPIKKWMYQYYDQNPYSVLGKIDYSNHLYDGLKSKFDNALEKYNRMTIMKNFPQYAYKSLLQIYSLIKYTPLNRAPDISADCYSGKFDIGCMITTYIFVEYNFYYYNVLWSLFPLLTAASIINVFLHIIRLYQQKTNRYSFTFIMLFTLIAYYMTMIGFGGFVSFDRLTAPIYIEIIILFSMTVYDYIRLTALAVNKISRLSILW